jgi:hypothetical protein
VDKRAAAVILAALAVLISNSNAVALGSHNYYAIGTFNNGNQYGGGYVQIKITNLYAGDCSSGGHTNQTIWVHTDNSSAYWVEVGYTYGFEGSCSETYYWAYQNTTAYNEYSLNRIDPIGTTHQFEGQEVYVGEYDVYIDNNKVGSDVGGNPWTQSVETGLEYTSYNSSLDSTPFDWHEVRYTACCTWIYWPSGSTFRNAVHTWTWTTQWIHAHDDN